MLDLLFVALGVVLFFVAAAYARACGRLWRSAAMSAPLIGVIVSIAVGVSLASTPLDPVTF
jgi:hypothetical protein